MSIIRVFFNPRRGERFVQQRKSTPIPVETSDGIVHRSYTDEELFEKYGGRDALTYDPAFLASKGIEPIVASASLVSPLDAHDAIVSSMDSIQLPESSSELSPESSNVEPSPESSNV